MNNLSQLQEKLWNAETREERDHYRREIDRLMAREQRKVDRIKAHVQATLPGCIVTVLW